MRFEPDVVNRLIESRWWEYGDTVKEVGTIEQALKRLAGAPKLAPHFKPYRLD